MTRNRRFVSECDWSHFALHLYHLYVTEHDTRVTDTCLLRSLDTDWCLVITQSLSLSLVSVELVTICASLSPGQAEPGTPQLLQPAPGCAVCVSSWRYPDQRKRRTTCNFQPVTFQSMFWTNIVCTLEESRKDLIKLKRKRKRNSWRIESTFQAEYWWEI